MTSRTPADLLSIAYDEAQRGLSEGGVPIGAALVAADGTVLGAGCNGAVQHGDQLLHGETVAIRAAGEQADYSTTTLVTTMTPCWYCAGLVRFLGIGTVAVGDSQTWPDESLHWLEGAGVKVVRLNDPACVQMFDEWLATNPPAWSKWSTVANEEED